MSADYPPIISIPQGASGVDATWQRRVVAFGATGSAVANEGNLVKQADVSGITCAIYNRSGESPGTPIATPSVSNSAINDTLILDNAWTANGQPIDGIGRNFTHTVSGSNYVNPSNSPVIYRTLYTISLNGGSKIIFGFDMPVINESPTVPGGEGSIAWAVKVEDSSNTPIPGCSVLLTSDAAGALTVAGPVLTDANGNAQFSLAAGTYYAWRTLPGYGFNNPQTVTVS